MTTLADARQALQDADTLYANYPTPNNNRQVVRAQRQYYLHLRNATPLRRANNMHLRAQQNLKRELHNPTWQAMARHQCTRMRHILLRMRALNALTNPPQPSKHDPRKRRPQPPPPKQRTIHPITRRYVYE
jgi:hypothetical protein